MKRLEHQSRYFFQVSFIKETNGTFSALALNLPGLVSSGDTEEEAEVNFHEAALGVLASYIDSGCSIPWKSAYHLPIDAKHKWIVVTHDSKKTP